VQPKGLRLVVSYSLLWAGPQAGLGGHAAGNGKIEKGRVGVRYPERLPSQRTKRKEGDFVVFCGEFLPPSRRAQETNFQRGKNGKKPKGGHGHPYQVPRWCKKRIPFGRRTKKFLLVRGRDGRRVSRPIKETRRVVQGARTEGTPGAVNVKKGQVHVANLFKTHPNGEGENPTGGVESTRKKGVEGGRGSLTRSKWECGKKI